MTVDIVTPRDVTQRGCQLSLSFSKSVTEIHSELKKLGVVVCAYFAGREVVVGEGGEGERRAGFLCPAVSLDIHSSSSQLYCRLFTLHAYPHVHVCILPYFESTLTSCMTRYSPPSSSSSSSSPSPSPLLVLLPLLPPLSPSFPSPSSLLLLLPPSSPSSSSSSSGGCKRRGSDESGSVSSRQHLHGCVHSGAANVPSLQQTPLAAVIQGEVNT